MNRVYGERVRSRQETSHLINSLPIVYCDHAFKKINLLNNSREVNMPEQSNNNESIGESSRIAMLKTIIDMYGRRTEKISWKYDHDWQTFMSFEDSDGSWSLDKFAKHYYVGFKGTHRNKLKNIHGKVVVCFTPSLSSDPGTLMYAQYCKLSLIRYKPWSGNYPYQVTTDEVIIAQWEISFLTWITLQIILFNSIDV